jgi:replication-associated recombination protein RarA
MLVKGDDMAKQNTRTVGSDANAALAYKFWLARCFHDGSPEEDLFRAVCANSMKIGVRQPPSRRTASQGKALGASVFMGT